MTQQISAKKVLAAAEARGLITSQSIGDVSVSFDVEAITKDLDGWADWKSTAYGIQFATMARLLGKAGMLIH